MSISPDTREYDSFGPWPLEVLSEEDVPRLYRGHPIDFDSAKLVMKVPRDIERRNATPDMDLYDSLVIAGQEGLTVLARVDDGFDESKLSYASIAMIETSVNLLDGRFRVLGREGTELRVPFNGSTRIVISRLIDTLRESVREHSTGRVLAILPAQPPARDALGEADVALTAAYQDLARAEPGLHYFGGYGRRKLVSVTGRTLRPSVLQAVLVFGSPGELRRLSRRDHIGRARVSDLSTAETVIELDRVVSVASVAHERFVDVDVVTVDFGGTSASFAVGRDTVVEAALLALGRH